MKKTIKDLAYEKLVEVYKQYCESEDDGYIQNKIKSIKEMRAYFYLKNAGYILGSVEGDGVLITSMSHYGIDLAEDLMKNEI